MAGRKIEDSIGLYGRQDNNDKEKTGDRKEKGPQ